MFYCEEKRRKEYDVIVRKITVFSGGEKVGSIEQSANKNWHGEISVSWDVYSWNRKDKRLEYISNKCTNVADGKRKLKAYIEQHPEEFAEKSAAPAILPADENSEFYPTPDKLAGKMLGKVDWKGVHTVLEPSAGKGDLVEALRKFIEHDRYKKYNRICYDMIHNLEKCVDVIEYDYNLRLILRGKQYHLIADDFLTFNSEKYYDLILMNPPFSNGDEHLLKAMDFQKRGGQIVCLLNAETIRNPYTNRRKLLKQKLADYCASIEFVSGAFSHAERRTNVEVVIVYVNIPRARKESHFFEGMKKAVEEQSNVNSESTALVYGDDIQQMIQHFQVEAKAGAALIEEYAALAPHIINGSDAYSKPIITLKVEDKDYSSANSEIVNQYLRALRYKYWAMFLDRPKVKSKLTSAMRDEYYDKLKEMEDYDFTEHNIMQLMYDINIQLQGGVVDAIMGLFDQLSAEHAWYPECEKNIHYYNGWATNKAHKVNMKVILPINGYSSHYNLEKTWSLSTYSIIRTMSDLEKSLDFLNRGTVAFREDIEYEVERAERSGRNTMHFTYFDATFYKKGTCHIKFHEEARPIIDRLNIFAARSRAWLPPSYGRKHYEDMSEKEKEVIDEFQGRDEYEKVVQAPANYILDGASMALLTA